MRDYRLYLEDILHAMKSIEHFVEGMDFSGFVADDRTVSAVLRKFEVIGEASKHIPDEIRGKYPTVAWTEMAAMRDKLIHGYFGVDDELVWKAVKKRIPELKPIIEEIIKSLK
jgi:uncharacterized protein with HEPN domain